MVGRHGGGDRNEKLNESIKRMSGLYSKIKKFSPDLVISYCSPEAARISFGLGIKHIAFCDSPHADAVMRLTLPLIQKLLIPKMIQKKEFSKYGINEKNIIQYNAIDAAVTIKRKMKNQNRIPFTKKKKNILIRIEEEQAAYTSKSDIIIPIIKKIISEFKNENILILGRYPKQIEQFKKICGNSAKIIKMSYDGKQLLEKTDVFIGSGGTMTAESTLLGVPTISYNAIPNIIENYLVQKKMLKRETNPTKIARHMNRIFDRPDTSHKKRIKKIVNSMDSPIELLVKIINQ